MFGILHIINRLAGSERGRFKAEKYAGGYIRDQTGLETGQWKVRKRLICIWEWGTLGESLCHVIRQ